MSAESRRRFRATAASCRATFVATCPIGTTVIGGGGRTPDPPVVAMREARPTDTGGGGQLRFNGPSAANEITIDAVCATVEEEPAPKEGETPQARRTGR